MKKFLAILLAMMLVMVSVAALASEGGTTQDTQQTTTVLTATTTDPAYEKGSNPTPEQPLTGVTFTIDKKYTLLVDQNALLPADVITYTAKLRSILKSTVKYVDENQLPVTIIATDLNTAMKDDSVSGTEKKYDEKIKITLPDYTNVGIYTYEVKETGKDAAGVTYTDDTVYMKVTVINKDAKDPTKGVVIAGISFRKTEDKTGEVTDASSKLGELSNDYKSGTLVVEKSVTGNLGEVDRDFTFTITLTSEKDVLSKITYALSTNATITKVTGATLNETDKTLDAGDGWKSTVITATLRDTDTITLYNIPDGVKYKVEEKHEDGYDVKDEVKDATAITAGTSTKVTVVNDKDVTVDTGITLETLPYVLMMALAMMGLVALKLRKREEY